jgi:hypothetical protein
VPSVVRQYGIQPPTSSVFLSGAAKANEGKKTILAIAKKMAFFIVLVYLTVGERF